MGLGLGGNGGRKGTSQVPTVTSASQVLRALGSASGSCCHAFSMLHSLSKPAAKSFQSQLASCIVSGPSNKGIKELIHHSVGCLAIMVPSAEEVFINYISIQLSRHLSDCLWHTGST